MPFVFVASSLRKAGFSGCFISLFGSVARDFPSPVPDNQSALGTVDGRFIVGLACFFVSSLFEEFFVSYFGKAG